MRPALRATVLGFIYGGLILFALSAVQWIWPTVCVSPWEVTLGKGNIRESITSLVRSGDLLPPAAVAEIWRFFVIAAVFLLIGASAVGALTSAVFCLLDSRASDRPG